MGKKSSKNNGYIKYSMKGSLLKQSVGLRGGW